MRRSLAILACVTLVVVVGLLWRGSGWVGGHGGTT